jgi:hypothetical protein
MTFEFEVLAAIVFLNVLATITLWRTAARRPEKLKKKFLNRLWRSKPITPKHEPPPPLKQDTWSVRERDLQFFSDFEDFANVVNWWLADPDAHPEGSPWRLQELPKSVLLKFGNPEYPTYGRCYAVFHNQARLGEIEVAPDLDYSTQTPRVRLHVELDSVRLLALGTIRSFLTDLALHISEYRSGTVEYLQTNQEIDLALTDVLWETQEISEFGMENEPGYGRIEVQLSGLLVSTSVADRLCVTKLPGEGSRAECRLFPRSRRCRSHRGRAAHARTAIS